ncbi:MAG: hypothetical protein HF978_12095 [Desulfobacteraceae bacterium]|nr:hypothetical protein [Desulfobacteraceae bacterium]MBC2756278.1 hypothetical protein [Desulfobacteraceae bacterium]
MKPDNHQKTANGRYDFNLAEFPICVFSRVNKEKHKSLEYTDRIKGKKLKRKWTVTWDSKYGPPTASTNNVLYELMQIWKEDNFGSQKIVFHSAYNLLKRMGKIDKKKKQGKAQRLQLWKDIKILRGVVIDARNSFWDNEKKLYVHKNFNLFDEFETYEDELDGKMTKKQQQNLFPSWIKASDVLYQSVKSNSLFDTRYNKEFYYSLNPIQQRIFLYLQKVFRSQKKNRRPLMEFASQIPILSSSEDKIKQTIRKHCDDLIDKKGYKELKRYYFEKSKDGWTNICFVRNGKERFKPAINPAHLSSCRSPEKVEELTMKILSVCGDKKSTNYYRKVAASKIPESLIISAIEDVRQAKLEHRLRGTAGAMFTYLIKRTAKVESVSI